MPNSETALVVLSIVAPIVATVAAVWGLTKELSVQDDEGGKQLTKAGRIAIGLAITSALIATMTIGFRAHAEGQKRYDEKQLAAQRKANEDRAKQDEANWKRLNSRQMQFLALLGLAETRNNAILSMLETKRSAGRVISNSDLLAAIERQRDFRISDYTNRNIRAGSLLNFLSLRITIGGFSVTEYASLVEMADSIAGMPERDDEYRALVGSGRRWYDDANYFEGLFGRALAILTPEHRHESGEFNDHVLVLALSEDGSWILPIGFTNQPITKGFIFNRDWLSVNANPNMPNISSSIEQNLGRCGLPNVRLDRTRKEVVLNLEMGPGCLANSLHKAGAEPISARLTVEPRAEIVFGDGDEQLVNASNVFGGNPGFSICLQGNATPRSRHYLALSVVANKLPESRLSRVLHFGRLSEISDQITTYDNPTSYGLCRVIA